AGGHSSGCPPGSPMTNCPAGTRTSSSVTPSPRSSTRRVAPAACWQRRASDAPNGQPGHSTASAGAALAVDCRKFTELGGLDPLYLPGVLDQLDVHCPGQALSRQVVGGGAEPAGDHNQVDRCGGGADLLGNGLGVVADGDVLDREDAAGVEAGDFITHVDGESLLGLTLDEAVELMRGPVGSEIIVTLVREGRDEPFDVSIIRDTIKLTAVRTRTQGETVVLRVTTFNDQTFPNLKEGMEQQIEEAGGIDKVNGFILDLRNNPGGLLTQAIRVSDAFLEEGEIVSTRGREVVDSDRFNATPGDLANGKPIVVLINGGSASASEIVAGALQDHRRAIVVGTKSFGKGSVQTVMPLRGDGAMRLTTARYYTPSGRSIQSLGVSPDIVVQQPPRTPEEDESEEDLARPLRSEADLRGAITNDSMSEDEKRIILEEQEKAEEAAKLRDEDYQLAYAIDILKGLTALDTPSK
ncbi:hypothetical protein LCGC14_2257850, partial [marine sediment metagenome]